MYFVDGMIELLLENIPEWQIARTSTGSEPLLRDSSKSKSERFFVVSLRLKRYHGEPVLLLGSVSETIGYTISAPPDDRLRRDFFRNFDFPLWQLLRLDITRLSHGTELRRWLMVKEDESGRICSTMDAKNENIYKYFLFRSDEF